MRGLTIVFAGQDGDRLHAALSLAAAQAAMGARARLFLQGEAVALLRAMEAPGDDARMAAGLPSLQGVIGEALALGVEVVACQSGLVLAGCDATALDARVTTGGLVGLLATLNDDRLLFA